MHVNVGGGYETVGGIKCFLPRKPSNNQIIGYNLKKKDQKFKRLELPDWYNERRLEEEYEQEKQQKLVESGQIDKVTYFDPVLEKFRIDAWNRRLYGIWVYINGTPYYLTGRNTFYLDWCKGDHAENEGYPVYYDSMRKRFYFRERCQTDPHCLGYIMIGPRGYGKTTEEVSVVLNNMTMPPHRAKAAIQSKTEDDARDVIMKGKFIPTFNELPHFFKPTYNHGSNPERFLSFFRPRRGGNKAAKVKYGDDYELGNKINIFPSKEVSLDGQTLQEIINDEIGKTELIDVYKRMQVNRFCVYRNHKKIGLIRAMSTVEEMENGGAECFKIWNDSNPEIRSENGYTKSGLYRLFIPDYEITHIEGFVDEYGFVDKKKAIKFHDAERKALEKDSQALNSYIRKNPRNPEEAFLSDASKCLFNHNILSNRQMELNTMDTHDELPFVRGDFYWVDGERDGLVGFKPNDKNGKFNLTKILDAKGEEFEGDNRLCNNVGMDYDPDGKRIYHPKNDRYFVIGCDPIRFTKTDDSRASKAGAFCFEKLNPSIDSDKPKSKWLTNMVCMEYLERPERPEDAAEDMIMACRYFGCSINIEGNIASFGIHFKNRGYWDFCIVKSDFNNDEIVGKINDDLIHVTEEFIQDYIGKIQSFVMDHGHRIPFPRLVKQLLEYTRKKHTFFDLIPALGFTLYGVLKRQENDWEEIPLGDIMDEMEYNNGRLVIGERSERETVNMGAWDF